jgi:hypothetical protein
MGHSLYGDQYSLLEQSFVDVVVSPPPHRTRLFLPSLTISLTRRPLIIPFSVNFSLLSSSHGRLYSMPSVSGGPSAMERLVVVLLMYVVVQCSLLHLGISLGLT